MALACAMGICLSLPVQAYAEKGEVNVEVAQAGLTIGKLTSPQQGTIEKIVKDYLKGELSGAKAQPEQISTEEQTNFVINSKEKKDGETEVRLSQTYKNMKVYGQDVIVKVDSEGVVTTVSGKVANTLDKQANLRRSASITVSKLKSVIRQATGVPFQAVEKEFKRENVVFQKEDGTYTVAAVVQFAYESKTDVISGNAIVDLTDGKVLFIDHISKKKEVSKIPTNNALRLLTTKELGSGTDALGTNMLFNISKGTDQNYYLADLSRGNGIYVYNANYADAKGGRSNVGYPGTLISSPTTKFEDKEAVGVMKNMSSIYDYFKKEHNLKSYDNKDAKVVASVHGFDSDGTEENAKPSSWVNAFWHPGWKQMVFGDGLNGTLTSSIDVTAHEFGHAVFSGNTKNNVVKYPSKATRAINEGLADFWGVQVERYVDKKNWDWVMGNTLKGLVIRDIPKEIGDGGHKLYTNLNDFYNTAVNEQESHMNSGIISHVLYQLVEGKTHNGVTTEALGHDKVSKIVMHTLQNYATAGEEFETLQVHMLQSATELYGDKEAEEFAKAFEAHGYPDIDLDKNEKAVTTIN
ncbi:M4 family metallopeptidase [Priestia taiwanensis]|nr:M4 family metallopeptidase [Priestia taiwanensis]